MLAWALPTIPRAWACLKARALARFISTHPGSKILTMFNCETFHSAKKSQDWNKKEETERNDLKQKEAGISVKAFFLLDGSNFRV